jgi:hypothetical protein
MKSYIPNFTHHLMHQNHPPEDLFYWLSALKSHDLLNPIIINGQICMLAAMPHGGQF